MMYRIVNGLVAIPPTELHTSTTARGHTARFIVLYARTIIVQYPKFDKNLTSIGQYF
jgi:hypothetical protein